MNKVNEKFDIYQMVTNQIIEILETHQNLDYKSNWTPSGGEILANNPVSKTVYRGFNQLYLCFVAQKQKYEQNRRITIHQGNELGAMVKKGEKGQAITYWGKMYLDETTGRNLTAKVKELTALGKPVPKSIKLVRLLRYYNVFNLSQFENLPEKVFFKGETITFTEPEKDETAEEFIIKSGAQIKYVRDGKNCYYPALDFIQLCEREQFTGKESFYNVAFHEVGHWSGHTTRLNRPIKNAFGTKEYALDYPYQKIIPTFCINHLVHSILIP